MGRNGAGKTTTMKAIMGLMAQSTGKIRFDGHDISGRQPYEIARLGLGFTPEDRRIFSDLTVLENLDIGRQPPRKFSDGVPAPVWTEEKLLALFPNLGEMPNRPGGRMSGGEQQMLTVARTLMGNPLLILLDEPSEGVAPADRRADGQYHSRAQEGRGVDPAVGAERAFRRAGLGQGLCPRKGPDPMEWHDGRACGEY